jgi:hypothetical protein
MQIYENPFTKSSEQLETSTNEAYTKDKATSIFKHKTYADRFKPLHRGTNVLSFVCGILSALSAFAIVAMSVFKSLEPINYYIALGLGVGLGLFAVALIEIIKRAALKEFLVELFLYKRVTILLGTITLAACAVSVYSSYEGAKLIPQLTATRPLIANVDSIETAHTAQIAAATILHTYKPTKTLTKQGAVIIAAMQTDKRQAMETARAANVAAVEASEIDKSGNVYALVVVALINEGVLLGCLFFGMFYYWQCFKAVKAAEINETTPTPIDTKPRILDEQKTSVQKIGQTLPHRAPPTNRKIGFFNGDETSATRHEFSATNETGTATATERNGARYCLHCNESYTVNHNKQKFCSSRCRIANYKLNNPKKLKGL